MNGPSPQEVRGLYPLQAPQSLGPRSERRDSPKCLDLKTNRAYLTEKLRTSGNKEFLPLQQNHSPQDPAQRATVSKELRPYVKEIHLLTLQHLSKGQKSAGTLQEWDAGSCHFYRLPLPSWRWQAPCCTFILTC